MIRLILPGGIIVPAKLRKREIEKIYSRLRIKSPAKKRSWFQRVAAIFKRRVS